MKHIIFSNFSLEKILLRTLHCVCNSDLPLSVKSTLTKISLGKKELNLANSWETDSIADGKTLYSGSRVIIVYM